MFSKKNIQNALLIFLFSYLKIVAQEIELKGLVTDSLLQPLSYSNIIVTNLDKENSSKFTISDENGRYRMKILKGVNSIEIRHLGYAPKTIQRQYENDTVQNFILKEMNHELDEVVIKQRLAVVVKEDTIVYRPENFKNGEERKLKEILKKLPGVEVDRSGNVTVNGKDVDKLLVDGKPFFTGDEKLGVNNIPSEVIDEIEVLDNYSEVAFLKGLSDSDKMALNIKLKKGKKRFMFGDIESGGGIKERYTIHPNLFYYSPKTNVNFIGDFNNIGIKQFSIGDYINFEGGFTKIEDEPEVYAKLLNSDFSKFLDQDDFFFNKNIFGAFNLNQKIWNKTDIQVYSINSKSLTNSRKQQTLSYLTDTTALLEEERETKTINDLFFTLNKINLKHFLKTNQEISYNTFIKASNGDSEQNVLTNTDFDSNTINRSQKPTELLFTQNVRYDGKISKKHIITSLANYTFSNNENNYRWLLSEQIFNGLIPLNTEDDSFNIFQNVQSQKNEIDFSLKDYWVINKLNHLYTSVGINIVNQNFNSITNQILNDGSTNQFRNNGFDNDVTYSFFDQYLGLEYKKKINRLTIKPGLFYHYYNWSIDQFEDKIVSNDKIQIAPRLLVEYKLKNAEKFTFNYNLRSSFSDAAQFSNRLRLNDFNNLFRGNETLENQFYHSTSLRYNKFSLYRGITLNIILGYNSQIRSIRNNTEIEGIDQVNSLIYNDLPEERYSIIASFSKKLNKLKLTLNGNTLLSDYSRLINNQIIDYNVRNYVYTIKGETLFDNLPNIEIGFKHTTNRFNSDTFNNEFIQLEPYAIINYNFLHDFNLKADYTYNYYENRSMRSFNRFQIGNFSLLYNREDSPWGMELLVNNVFDIKFRNENSFNQFLVSDINTFIQSRTIIFKLAYKL